MHYFIDGYNVLFRVTRAHQDLQNHREQIVYDLNKKISLLKMDVSIVFDATFQAGERSRTHYDALEILFTAEGETADQFILDELKDSTNPHQETVVTSDKTLAWHARRHSAHTQNVEEFLFWLNKSYKKKQHQLIKKEKTLKHLSPTPTTPPLISPTTHKTNIEECVSYYEQIFEEEFQKLLQIEQSQKSALSPTDTQSATKKSSKKKKKPPQELHLREVLTDFDRWLKIFEENLKTNL